MKTLINSLKNNFQQNTLSNNVNYKRLHNDPEQMYKQNFRIVEIMHLIEKTNFDLTRKLNI